MGSTRTAWHVLLTALLTERAPRRFEVRSEVPLSTEPLRADLLLLRNTGAADDSAGTLRKLWGLLPTDTLVEFKSVGRPYRSRNFDRLQAYLSLHYADEPERLASRDDLAGALLVPSRTPSLDADVSALGLEWQEIGGGYWELSGRSPFALYVVEIDLVAETEDDDLLRLFGHGVLHTTEARRWFQAQVGSGEVEMAMHEMEDYDEVLDKLIAAASPERRVAGLTPQQRLAGLAPEQILLTLPDDILRGLSDAYLQTLSPETRAAIRARIGR
jgi:hypothetical protein